MCYVPYPISRFPAPPNRNPPRGPATATVNQNHAANKRKPTQDTETANPRQTKHPHQAPGCRIPSHVCIVLAPVVSPHELRQDARTQKIFRFMRMECSLLPHRAYLRPNAPGIW